LADCCVDGEVVEGAVGACPWLVCPVEPEGVVWACPVFLWPELSLEEVEFPLELVEPADWLEGAEVPAAVEFCVEVPCAGAACGADVDAGGFCWLCAGDGVADFSRGVVGD
jgi:hypothetical protein